MSAATDNGNSPAMPQEWEAYAEGISQVGLTKREHFAGLAMQGLLASGEYNACDGTAEQAWNAADSLLYMQDKANND
jgi:hypothetical protein